MLFNSVEFILIFLPIVLAGFQLCAIFSRRAAIWWLTVLSVIFYGVWDVRAVVFLVASILVNYAGAWSIARFRESTSRQTAILAATITLNLGALCYFKYLFSILNFLHHSTALPWTMSEVILPLGISFFTFTQIAYLIDLRQGEAELEPLINYAFFVTFFPHLIAGPILHHHEIMPQLIRRQSFRLSKDDLASGMTLFVFGLFKKVVLADRAAHSVPALFNDPSHASLALAWGGSLAYAMQLYFDFSGYSDMAVGLALMFSIRFPLNFNSPYKSRSIIEFWQRFHMTLSRYLTLYLYNPISLAITRRDMRKGRKGNPKAKITMATFSRRLAVPTIATMFIAGVWHGAGFQFLVFGLLHGIYITINHAWRMFGAGVRAWAKPFSDRFPSLVAALSVLIVFLAVVVGEIFFRSHSVGDGLTVVTRLIGAHSPSHSSGELRIKQWIFLAILLSIAWFLPNSQTFVGYSPDNKPAEPVLQIGSRMFTFAWQPSPAWAAIIAFIFTWSLINSSDRSEFLYFKF